MRSPSVKVNPWYVLPQEMSRNRGGATGPLKLAKKNLDNPRKIVYSSAFFRVFPSLGGLKRSGPLPGYYQRGDEGRIKKMKKMLYIRNEMLIIVVNLYNY